MTAIATPAPAAMLLRFAPGLLLLAAVLVLFRDTATAMVTIWMRSDTFAHAFLVPPIVAWLVWRRRDELATLPQRPASWALLPIAATCVLWLAGQLVGVNAATQFALVALLVLSVPAVFGTAVAHALTFPLLFLFFAVPFGDFMVPYMMDWTADFTVTALQWSGVPVYREGLQFVIPSGQWSVVQACSGVRYLIASFMVGTLFAYLNFNSARKRVLFMLVSLAVPILANWLRAYIIVMLGHLSNNKLAAGVDHIIYGWLFFGVVIGLMFMIGARWAEPEVPHAATVGHNPPQGGHLASVAAAWGMAGAVVLLLLGTQGASWHLDRGHENPAPAIALPPEWGDGTTGTAGRPGDWVPGFKNARVVAAQTYKAGNEEVGVWVGYYRDQGYDRKLVTSTNTMTDFEGKEPWAGVGRGQHALPQPEGSTVEWRTAVLSRGTLAGNSAAARRLRVWQVYWIGGRWIVGDARAQLQLAANRLMGRGDDGAVIFLHVPLAASSGPEAVARADAVLEHFAAAQLPRLKALLDTAHRVP